ncbi:MAG: VIT1/CCC1 transporter family protein [archaeon]|nr:VIT1/CCC1 transporter family protein [archaeon]
MNLKNLVRDFVFGMEDGLVSNLGLVLGVYIGGGGKFAIVLAGLASMFAGAFSMSAGSYLSAKSQREVYENEIESTRKELKKNPRRCISEMKTILFQEGLAKKDIDNLFKNSPKAKHPEFVCNYMVQRKVGISAKKLEFPFKNAFAMFFSFLVGSSFPIAPFIFLDEMTASIVAVILTIIALFLVGLTKSTFTKRSGIKSGIEIVIVGLIAGTIGYVVGLILSMF